MNTERISPGRRRVPSSINAAVARRVQRAAPGTVFTPALFTKAGSRAAIDKALQRLVDRGTLRRLSRGLYDKPRQHALLGTLWPNLDEIVRALSGRDRLRVQPTGVYAANLLGLSEQVPARIEFLTDGASRTVRAGPMHIRFRRITPRQMAVAGRCSGLVIQAFRAIGRVHVGADRIDHLRRALPARERRALLNDMAHAPGWMHPLFRRIAEGGND